MKELSIEEKARRYDEALIRGSKLWESDIITKESYEYIFPELAEREEEYKRWLINLVKGHIEWLKDRINEQLSNGLIYQGELNKALEALDWLEKQGQVKESQIFQHEIGTCKENGDSLTSEDERIRKEIMYHIQNCDDTIDEQTEKRMLAWLEKQGEYINFRNTAKVGDRITKSEDGVLVNLSKLNRVAKKHDEQKPDDKVEPKFHKGQWITNGDYTWQIVDVTEFDYILQSQEGNKVDDTISHVDEQFHVFSIQDAKDGDVLVASDGSIFLFAGVVDCGCKYYIALTTNGSVIFNKGLKHFWETSRVVLPATKKQRDLLFQKMKEAGYEWDAEKKELKKIEQKPAWSEEDEVALGDALWAIQQSRTIAKDENDMGNLWFAECWLKSLKERYTWKPSDEQMEALYTYIYNPQYINNSEDERIKLVISLYEQLKRL